MFKSMVATKHVTFYGPWFGFLDLNLTTTMERVRQSATVGRVGQNCISRYGNRRQYS
jgi:hypothetical protein